MIGQQKAFSFVFVVDVKQGDGDGKKIKQRKFATMIPSEILIGMMKTKLKWNRLENDWKNSKEQA